MTKQKKQLNPQGLETYPLKTILTENIFMLLWITIGTYLIWTFKPTIAWAYLAFTLTMVLFIMRILVCKNCYYHGKFCHTGWGKLSALYCKQGKIEHFGCGFSGAIIPIFYGSIALLPLILGITTLIKAFSIVNLIVIVGFVVVVVMSSYTLRKKACGVCKMRDLCPGAA
jgi:hypothetical protein